MNQVNLNPICKVIKATNATNIDVKLLAKRFVELNEQQITSNLPQDEQLTDIQRLAFIGALEKLTLKK